MITSPLFWTMQFFGTGRTIPEKALNSLASAHCHPLFLTEKSSRNTGSRRGLTEFRNSTPTRDISERNGKLNACNECKVVLQDDVTLLRAKARHRLVLESLRSSPSRLNNGLHVPFGAGAMRSSASSFHALRYNKWDCQLRWTAAKRCSQYLKDDPGSSGFAAAKGNELGRRFLWNGDDRAQRKLFRSEAVSEASGEIEGGENNHNTKSYDAILVLAGGQVVGGGVPAWVKRRLDKALDLHQRSTRNNSGGAVGKIVCLGGGTPHREPILSSHGFVIHESTSCAEYLHSRGAPFASLMKEWASYDTIGNGYFSLTQHVIPRRWKTLAVVTSEFHMPRTRAVFEWIFGLQGAGLALQQLGPQNRFVDGAVTAATGSKAQGFHLEFHGVPDHGDLDESIAQARLWRERNSIKNLNMLSQRVKNLEDFHEWFHTEHKAYNTEDQARFGIEDKDDLALQSY